MEVKKVSINSIKTNPDNPRIIKDYKFSKLVNSIRQFPQMLSLRPIVVNNKNVILGGNMRYKASIEAGLKEVFIVQADNLTEEQQKEFIIKDNVGFGEWDWDLLGNNWDNELLNEWGLEVWQTNDNVDIDDMFEDADSQVTTSDEKIILQYEKEEYELITNKIKEDGRSAEDIFRTALDL